MLGLPHSLALPLAGEGMQVAQFGADWAIGETPQAVAAALA